MDYKGIVAQLKVDTLARLVADLTNKDGWSRDSDLTNLVDEAIVRGLKLIGDEFEHMVNGYGSASN